MNYSNFKNVIVLFTVCCSILLSFKTFGQQKDSITSDNRLMSKGVKHNKKIPRLTYFIHLEDSIIQLFNVSAVKNKEGVEIVGYAIDLDKDKINLYERMRDNPKIKFENENDKFNANQVHMFVQKIKYDEGKVIVNQSFTDDYVLYKNGMSKAKLKNWKTPVLLVGLAAGITTSVILILNCLQDALSS